MRTARVCGKAGNEFPDVEGGQEMLDLILELLGGAADVAGDLADGAGDLLADGIIDVSAAGDMLSGVDLLSAVDPASVADLFGAAAIDFDPDVFIPVDLAANTVLPDFSALQAPPDGVFSVGDSAWDALFWDPQMHSHSCAIACQTMVLESILGQDIPEGFLGQLALDNGWYTPLQGTDLSHMASCLEALGIPVESGYDKNMFDLIGALERGDKVIVGLNSSEIMYPLVDGYGVPVEQPVTGHAVMVTGLAPDEQGNWWVTINDPGVADGAAKNIPLKHFENAWSDFGHRASIVKGDLPHVA